MKGFTLIELLVAISIVGVLSAVTIVTINPFRQFNKAKDTQRQHTLSQLRTALADYYLDNDYYPESLEKLAEGNKPYINSLPLDPDGFSYEYLKPNVPNPQWAAVFSQLEPETTADATKSFCSLTTLDSGCVPTNYYYEQTKTTWACATVGKVVCSGTNSISTLSLPTGRIIRPTATTAPPTLAPTDAPTPTITLTPTATPISLPAPVAYWNMDEPLGTTTVANSPSGTGLDGTSYSSTNVSAGKFGNARTFDGTTDYIYIPDTASLRFTNGLTFAAWLDTSLTANGGLFSRGGGWSGLGWDIIINPGAMDFRSICLTSGTDNYTSTGLTSGSGWHHFVVTFDSVTHSIKTYRDGNLISSSVTGGDGTPKTPTGVLCGSSGQNYIGMGQESNFKYKGLMDEVRIYNRAFSPNEVQALYSITPANNLLPPSTQYARVFVTSTTYTGNFGGTTVADAQCQIRADTANLDGTWKAWVNGAPNDVNSRFTQATVPYKLIDGTVIANNWNDLIDSSINNPINKDEFGVVVPSSNVWTGGTTSWIQAPNTHRCSGGATGEWNDTTVSGAAGLTTATNSYWWYESTRACTLQHRLYCFEQEQSLEYVDNDNDGYGAGAVVSACPAGKTCVANNQDCYDNNPNAYPGQTGNFATNRGDGSFDYNCDGVETRVYGIYTTTLPSPVCSTTQPSGITGWVSTVPSCGSSALLRSCAGLDSCSSSINSSSGLPCNLMNGNNYKIQDSVIQEQCL